MSTSAERAAHLEFVSRLKSSYPELPDAPTPDLIDHERFWAYMKTSHDVGGEPDAPMKYENKQYEAWEHMTYVLAELLGWRGIWVSESAAGSTTSTWDGRSIWGCPTTAAGSGLSAACWWKNITSPWAS